MCDNWIWSHITYLLRLLQGLEGSELNILWSEYSLGEKFKLRMLRISSVVRGGTMGHLHPLNFLGKNTKLHPTPQPNFWLRHCLEHTMAHNECHLLIFCQKNMWHWHVCLQNKIFCCHMNCTWLPWARCHHLWAAIDMCQGV